MVSLRAPRELERYVFSPGGRSDSLVQAGGEEGLPEEGPEEWAPWGEDADEAKAIIKDSEIQENEQMIEAAETVIITNPQKDNLKGQFTQITQIILSSNADTLGSVVLVFRFQPLKLKPEKHNITLLSMGLKNLPLKRLYFYRNNLLLKLQLVGLRREWT